MRKSVIKKMLALIFSAAFVKVVGFLFRIYLSKVAGAEGCGVYHLVLSVYAFGASVASFGMNRTLSRLIAFNEKYSKRILRTALILTGAVSFIVSLVIFLKSEYIALYILKDARTTGSLRIISLCFPAIGAFSSISGYFNGLSKVKYGSNGQIIEQVARIAFVFLFLKKAINVNLEHGIVILSIGIVLGEYVSALYIYASYRFFQKSRKDNNTKKSFLKDILKISIPIASGGYISSLIHTLESILLPSRLSLFGLSSAKSVSILGIIKGMAMPVVFLPMIIISSMTVLIVPKISKEDSRGNKESIKSVAGRTLALSFLSGVASLTAFNLWGEQISAMIFKNNDALIYIKILSLSLPFLFFNITSLGILNGMGMQMLATGQNILSGLIKLVSVIIFVPKMGINGYFFGFIISEIICFIIHFIALYKKLFIKNG